MFGCKEYTFLATIVCCIALSVAVCPTALQPMDAEATLNSISFIEETCETEYRYRMNFVTCGEESLTGVFIRYGTKESSVALDAEYSIEQPTSLMCSIQRVHLGHSEFADRVYAEKFALCNPHQVFPEDTVDVVVRIKGKGRRDVTGQLGYLALEDGKDKAHYFRALGHIIIPAGGESC
eukprot:Nk52_evm8s2596 gene=Nk52_evmTU8s2596